MNPDSTPRIFHNGVPTGPDVERLEAALGIPAVDTLIPYASIDQVLGCTRKVKRWGSVVAAWRGKLSRQYSLELKAVPNEGFQVLNNSQRVELSGDKFKSGLRRIGKGVRIAAATPSLGLKPEEVRARDHIVNVGAMIRQSAATAARDLGFSPALLNSKQSSQSAA